MNSSSLKTLFQEAAEEAIPSPEVALWPGIQARLAAKEAARSNRGSTVGYRRARAGLGVLLLIVAAITAALAIPQGRAFTQEIIHFFQRASRDRLPLQPWQMTPAPEPTSPDPGDIHNATLPIDAVEKLAGFDVLVPTWLPAVVTFKGATYQPAPGIVRIFYYFSSEQYGPGLETNGLWLREEPYQQSEDCELCGTVGESAAVEHVQIGNVPGEYVEGVWKLTEGGPVWEDDPYLKTLRWQADGMAFELGYMGLPETVSKVDLIAVAESLK